MSTTGEPTTRVTVWDNGPLEVTGPFTLVTESGKVIALPAGEPVSLCRCGGSTDKPFCDGTHDQIGFQAAERAVAEADAKA